MRHQKRHDFSKVSKGLNNETHDLTISPCRLNIVINIVSVAVSSVRITGT